MKKALSSITASLLLLTALALPAGAAGADFIDPDALLPVDIVLNQEALEIRKVYDLSPNTDPSTLPREPFERDGYRYECTDILREVIIGSETQAITQTETVESGSKDMETILSLLPQEKEVTTEEGYTGVLRLDHTSVQVTTDGYATKTQPLSATRSYPNLSEADLSLIPKSIEEKGKTLTLADVQWSSSEQTDGAGGTVTRYTAAASYTGTSSYQYATGYTVTANYTGEVAKTGCSVVTYTAIFGSMEAPEESTEPESGNSTASAGVDLSTLKMPLLVGGVVVILAAGGVFVFKKLKERR